MRFLYFAYGSNMLTARLMARCPSANVIGQANAYDHALEFTKLSRDQSGKATIISTAGQGLLTHGVLFEIAKSDLPRLDRAEGVGYGYDRYDDFKFRLAANDEHVTATVYLASKTVPHLKPYDWYLALVIAGAHEHGLGAGYAERLRQIEHLVDGNLARESRADALATLAAHGIDDYYALLNHP